MAIELEFTTKSGVVGNYVRINRGEVIISPNEKSTRWDLWVAYYVSEAARKVSADPVMSEIVSIPFHTIDPEDLPALAQDPRPYLYAILAQQPDFVGAIHLDEDSDALSLEDAKARKKAEITAAKVQANRNYFIFRGKRIQADDDAMLQIQTTMNGVLARGALRDDWFGGWLTLDNDVVPIPDVETWFAFYAAIEKTGQANFDYSRTLKALVDQAATVIEVEAIRWGSGPSVLSEVQ